MGKLKAVLFDMDGVLMDSEEYIAEAGVRMFAEKGFTVTRSDFKPFVGHGENRFLGGVAAKYAIPFEIEPDKARTYEIYRELIQGKLKALPGAVDYVHICRKRALKTALVTSTDYIKMIDSLEAIGLAHGAFDTMINGLDVELRKPHPDCYQLAMERLGMAPDECLVIEDSIAGVESANAAGCRCLALTSSFAREELPRADWYAPGLDRVPREVLEW